MAVGIEVDASSPTICISRGAGALTVDANFTSGVAGIIAASAGAVVGVEVDAIIAALGRASRTIKDTLPIGADLARAASGGAIAAGGSAGLGVDAGISTAFKAAGGAGEITITFHANGHRALGRRALSLAISTKIRVCL